MVKTVKFSNPNYIGDPINTVKIFNEKQVDEIIIFDISAKYNKSINIRLLKEMSTEAFVPLTYGGYIHNLNDMEKIFKIGFEKIVINSGIKSLNFVKSAVTKFGSSSVVGCIDVARTFFKKNFVVNNTKQDVIFLLNTFEDCGVGVIIINDTDRDGTYNGLDIILANHVTDNTNVPVCLVGGTSSFQDAVSTLNKSELQAIGIGSDCVYRKKGQGVLIKCCFSSS